jgi:hypothetical protein
MGNAKLGEHCQRFSGVITANGENIMNVTAFTDKAQFHFLSYINCQKSRGFSATDPHTIKDTQFHN